MEINLSKLRELYSTAPINVSKQEIGKKQIIRKGPDYKVFEESILKGVREKQPLEFLLIESLVFIGISFNGDYKFPDLVYDTLKVQGYIPE